MSTLSPESPRSLNESPRTVTATYIKQTFITLVVVGSLYLLFGWWSDSPSFFDFLLHTHMPMINGLSTVWFVFVIAISAGIFTGLGPAILNKPRTNNTKQFFTRGTWLALNAGMFEEIMYRWLRLVGAIAILNILNKVTFGLVHLIVSYVLAPVAYWLSLGILDRPLSGHFGWLIAGGVIVASIRFKNVHWNSDGDRPKKGTFAAISAALLSWYFNLFMFSLVFVSGLWTAIVAHIVYELCVYWTRGAMNNLRPRNEGLDIMEGLIRAAGRS